MRFRDDVFQACNRVAGDPIDALKHHYGRKLSSRVADDAGISKRQAQRYLAGKVKNPNPDVMAAIDAAATPGVFVADVLANLSYIDCGTIDVEYEGQNVGSRNVGQIRVTGEVRAMLEEAGELYANGFEDEADLAFSRAIMGGYSQSRGNSFDELEDALELHAFHSTLRFT